MEQLMVLCVWIHNTCYSSHNHGSVENGVLEDVFSLQMGYFPLPWLWEEGHFEFSRYIFTVVCLFDSGRILMQHVFRARCFNGWHHSESTKGGKDLLTNRIGRVIWPIFPLQIFCNEDLIPISSLEFIVILDMTRPTKNAPVLGQQKAVDLINLQHHQLVAPLVMIWVKFLSPAALGFVLG